MGVGASGFLVNVFVGASGTDLRSFSGKGRGSQRGLLGFVGSMGSRSGPSGGMFGGMPKGKRGGGPGGLDSSGPGSLGAGPLGATGVGDAPVAQAVLVSISPT